MLLVYSTQWLAVLDELWQTRAHSTGTHVDENWYEYGDLETNVRADTALAQACIRAAREAGINSKAVDYDDFPIDTGTIVANTFLNPDAAIPAVIAANNLYHDFSKTEQLGRIAAIQADIQGKRAAVVAVGGLSASYFDNDIDIAQDHIASEADDRANRRLLDAAVQGGASHLREQIAAYNGSVKSDMGMKHLGWLLGAVGDYRDATVHGYGATYGSGAAVVEFRLH